LIPIQINPYIGECPGVMITKTFTTQTPYFFIRNHGPVPVITIKDFLLEIGGMVKRPRKLDFDDLKTSFKTSMITATLSCASN